MESIIRLQISRQHHFFFVNRDARITCKGINRASLQGNATQWEFFNESSHEEHVLKIASEISIVDNISIDDHPQLDLSSIHNNSQDDSNFCSQSTHDSNSEIWADNSGFLNEKC